MSGTKTDTSLPPRPRPLGRAETGSIDELLVVDTVIDGRYRIEALLGEGGMGAVYAAEHVKVGRRVAFKVLGAQWAAVGNVAQRFRDEARAASAAGHPNIIEVFDAGELPDGRPYLVMELLEGRELAEVIQAQGGLEPARACRIIRDVARALDAAHARGIIHRDLKGENVMLVGRAGEEIVKVLDFGIAANNASIGPRATTPGLIIGTPAYMAPEQAQGAKPTIAFDIYALGVVLHDALTARVPFEHVEGLALLAAKTSEPAPSIATLRDDLPQALVELVDSCLALDPTLRPATAREVADRLTEILELPGLTAQRGGVTDLLPPRGLAVRGGKAGGRAAPVPVGTEESNALRPVTKESRASVVDLAPTPAPEPEPRRRVVAPMIIAALAVIVLGLGSWMLRSRPEQVADVSPSEASPAREAQDSSPEPVKADPPAEPQPVAPKTTDAPPAEPPPTTTEDPSATPKKGGSSRPSKPTRGEPVVGLPSVSPDASDPPDASPASTTAACSRTRKQAKQAREAQDWDGVLRHTRSASCWTDLSDERQWLRAKAFSELGQWDECLKASRGLDSSEARKVQERCRLRKERGG